MENIFVNGPKGKCWLFRPFYEIKALNYSRFFLAITKQININENLPEIPLSQQAIHRH